MRTNRWSQEEVQYLRDNYQEKTTAEIAAHLGRNAKSVTNKLYLLRLRKHNRFNEELIKSLLVYVSSRQFNISLAIEEWSLEHGFPVSSSSNTYYKYKDDPRYNTKRSYSFMNVGKKHAGVNIKNVPRNRKAKGTIKKTGRPIWKVIFEWFKKWHQ